MGGCDPPRLETRSGSTAGYKAHKIHHRPLGIRPVRLVCGKHRGTSQSKFIPRHEGFHNGDVRHAEKRESALHTGVGRDSDKNRGFPRANKRTGWSPELTEELSGFELDASNINSDADGAQRSRSPRTGSRT